MKLLTKLKEVRRFLGMTGFYRKHINNYAKIATPQTNLTRKTQTFKWTDQCQTAFETLKEYLSKAPVLVRAQPHQPFILTTDATSTHVGGVLSQTQTDGETKPLGYFSKKLNSTESRYSATDKKGLAVLILILILMSQGIRCWIRPLDRHSCENERRKTSLSLLPSLLTGY